MMTDAHAKLVSKALKDPAFRAALLKDANAAIEKELGVKVPPGLRIKVVEDTPTTIHLALPVVAKGELSEADLETVAGGGDPFSDPFFNRPTRCGAYNNTSC
jgi:Nitrile hydratase, alpha chain